MPSLQSGHAPVLGIIESVPSAGLPPALQLLGEPRLNEAMYFQTYQLPTSSVVAVLNWGFAGSPVSYFGCRNDENPLLGSFPVLLNGSGQGETTVPPLTSRELLWSDLSWQVLSVEGGRPPSLSNGLITRIGGLYQ